MTWEVANSWSDLKPGIPALAQQGESGLWSASKAKNLKWDFLEKNIFKTRETMKTGNW